MIGRPDGKNVPLPLSSIQAPTNVSGSANPSSRCGISTVLG
ncbi:hypothetical protein NSK11_contig00236-0008 [Nocardia seriolae]|uniref:Uncharacterized protein n=1 Tax=Nocardia seriolae TaxID=37332 RepID=A0ABC9Z6S1_9NOCA|nr:hypothetical protein NSK11_contig00236-0008 [Nocardia seriolae]